MLNIRKWFASKKTQPERESVFEEKHETIIRKRQVAMKILNCPEVERRKIPVPVSVDRRVEVYDYHHKLA